MEISGIRKHMGLLIYQFGFNCKENIVTNLCR